MLQRGLQGKLNHFISIIRVWPQNRLHTPVKLHRTHTLRQTGHCYNLAFRLILSQHTRRKAGLCNRQDSISLYFLGNLHSCVADSVRRMNTLADALLLEDTYIIKRILGTRGNLCHRAHCLQRIFAARSFAAQHDNVGAIKDGVRHIARLRTCCTVAANHALKHLRRRNNRLACLIAAFDNILLHQRHVLSRNLYT